MAVVKCKRLPVFSKVNIDRFWSMVDICGQNECWPWTGRRDDHEYGITSFPGTDNKSFRVHRLALYFATGIDPYPLQSLHDCDNPPCCNPNHLYAGDSTDNNRDTVRRNRHVSYKHLHAELFRGEALPWAKLTEQIVLDIRLDWSTGKFLQREIAEKHNVTQCTVSKVILRQTWKHI